MSVRLIHQITVRNPQTGQIEGYGPHDRIPQWVYDATKDATHFWQEVESAKPEAAPGEVKEEAPVESAKPEAAPGEVKEEAPVESAKPEAPKPKTAAK